MGDPGKPHDWFVAIISIVGAVVLNLVIYAYGQGKQEHRIETLEKQMAQLHQDWKDARRRLEEALGIIGPPR